MCRLPSSALTCFCAAVGIAGSDVRCDTNGVGDRDEAMPVTLGDADVRGEANPSHSNCDDDDCVPFATLRGNVGIPLP